MNPIKLVFALVALTIFAAIPAVLLADGGDEKGAQYGNAMRPLIEDGGSNIYGPGNVRIARTNDASHETLVSDHLLSARLLLGSGSTTHDEYGPFGTPVGTIGRYTGHPYDAHQGLYFTPGRSQDPSLGRFISLDPMRQGASPYHYAGSNPIGYVDPGGDILTPYFIESNTDPAYSYSMARDVMVLFGAPRGMHVVHDSAFKSRPSKKSLRSDGLTSAMSDRSWVKLRGRNSDGTPKYERTAEFYWIMGGNKDVELPDELVPMLDQWGSMRQGSLSRVIILDFTGKGTGAANQAKLRALGRDSLVIDARVAELNYSGDKSGGLVPSQYSVKTGGEVKKMGKSEFRTYVRDRITERWGPAPMEGVVEPIRPGVLRGMDSPPPRKKTRAAGSLPVPTETDPTTSSTPAEQQTLDLDTRGMFFDTIIPEDLFER